MAAKHLLCWHFGANLILSNSLYFHRVVGAMTLYYLNVGHVLAMRDMKLIDLMTIEIAMNSIFYEKCPFACPDYRDLWYLQMFAFEFEKCIDFVFRVWSRVCALMCGMLFDLSNIVVVIIDYSWIMECACIHKLSRVKVNGHVMNSDGCEIWYY